jgi:DNA-binding GntR family transcriptional regulator
VARTPAIAHPQAFLCRTAAHNEGIAPSNREHAQLIGLYRTRDSKRAIAMIVQHLRATMADIERAHQLNAI